MGAESVRIRVYSEVGYPRSVLVSGVTNLIRRFAGYAGERALDLSLVACAQRHETVRWRTVTWHGVASRLPMVPYPGLEIDLAPPPRDVVRREISSAPDVVVILSPGPLARLGLRVAQATGAALIALYTTDFPGYAAARVARRIPDASPLREPLTRAARRFAQQVEAGIYDRADLVLAPSRVTAGQIANHVSAPIDVLGRGVDTTLFRPRDHRPPGPLRVLYAGRMHIAEKNLAPLVAIAACRPDIELHLLGDGPHRDRLAAMIGDRVVVHGLLEGADLANAYRQADLFLFPSVHDTLGQVVLEAMASGLPVVVTDRGGPQELIRSGHDGIVCPPDRLVHEASRLLDDPGRREQLGNRARESSMAHRWEHVFDRLVELAAGLRASDGPTTGTGLARSA